MDTNTKYDTNVFEVTNVMRNGKGFSINVNGLGTLEADSVEMSGKWMMMTNTQILHFSAGKLASNQILVLSTDHISGHHGMYFNFHISSVDKIVGNTSWSDSIFRVRKEKTGEELQVKLWRHANGGSYGDGHGRRVQNPDKNQWEIGDILTFLDFDGSLCNKTKSVQMEDDMGIDNTPIHQENKCICEHGTATNGPLCNQTGASKCIKCDEGFHLVDDACIVTHCDASEPPYHGQRGNCTANLASGSTCLPQCDDGYSPSQSTSCDNGKLIPALCVKQDSCTDFDNWADSEGFSCSAYGGCNHVERWAINGVSANEACCLCGGGSTGIQAHHSPVQTQGIITGFSRNGEHSVYVYSTLLPLIDSTVLITGTMTKYDHNQFKVIGMGDQGNAFAIDTGDFGTLETYGSGVYGRWIVIKKRISHFVGCKDYDWTDTQNYGCSEYGGCDDVQRFAVNGISAQEACCLCGGGTKDTYLYQKQQQFVTRGLTRGLRPTESTRAMLKMVRGNINHIDVKQSKIKKYIQKNKNQTLGILKSL